MTRSGLGGALAAAVLIAGCGGNVFSSEGRPAVISLEAGDDGAPQPGEDSATDGGGGDDADPGADAGPIHDAGHPRDAGEDVGTVDAGGPDSGGDVADEPDADDSGCPLVTHSDGLGQSWTDCTPLGTYSQDEALAACNAWASSLGLTPSGCTAYSVCQGQLWVAHCSNGNAPPTPDPFWVFNGTTTSTVQPAGDVVSAQYCNAAADQVIGHWQ